ncbi:MAG: hypothetical protein KDA41_03965, partial [Planctomycetales bacterium]|nr:hypothetical protein [Planctomycetales bacterium]
MFGGAELLLITMFYGGIGLPLGVPPAKEDPLMARVAPPDCLYYMTWSGMDVPDASRGNHTEALLAEPQVQALVAAINKQLETGFAKLSVESRTEGEKLLASMAPTYIRAALTGSGAVYVSKFAMHRDGPPDVEAALVMNLGDDVDKISASLAQLQRIYARGDVETIELAGTTFHRLPLGADAPAATWGVKGRYLIVGVGDNAVAGLLKNAGSEPPKWLADARASAGVPRISTLSYANVTAISASVAKAFGDGDEAAQALHVIDALGLGAVSNYVSVTGLDDAGFVSRTQVGLEGKPTGVLALLDAEGLTDEDLAPIPLDSTIAMAWRLDLQEALGQAEATAERIDPSAAEELREGIDMASQMLGLDVEQDLLAGLGDAWRVYNSPGEGGLLFTGLTGVVDVRDHAKAAKAQKQLLALAVAAMRGPDGPDGEGRARPQIKTMQFAGQEIHYLTGVESMPLAPAWCLTEKHFIVSTFPQNVVAVLSRGDEHQSLAAHPDVAVALKAEARPLLVGYADTQALF